MALIGYARVSTDDQNAALQTDALLAAGCKPVFADKVSGIKTIRPELEKALAFLRPGDVLVVWKLDRLGRSMRHLVELINGFGKEGIGFRSLTEAIDTSSPAGELMFHILGALAQFERDLIRERTRAGLRAAASRGRKGGRPSIVTNQLIAKVDNMQAKGFSVREIALLLKVGKSTLYNVLAERQGAARDL